MSRSSKTVRQLSSKQEHLEQDNLSLRKLVTDLQTQVDRLQARSTQAAQSTQTENMPMIPAGAALEIMQIIKVSASRSRRIMHTLTALLKSPFRTAADLTPLHLYNKTHHSTCATITRIMETVGPSAIIISLAIISIDHILVNIKIIMQVLALVAYSSEPLLISRSPPTLARRGPT